MDRRQKLTGLAFLVVLIALGVAQQSIGRVVAAQSRGVQAPRFEVDFMWPRPLPNHWVLGNAIGVWADERDHVWIVHRGSDTLANNEMDADASFALAVWFHNAKNDALAKTYFERAQTLNPDDWNYHRQDWSFTPGEAGAKWMEKFQKLEAPYYPTLELKPKTDKPKG